MDKIKLLTGNGTSVHQYGVTGPTPTSGTYFLLDEENPELFAGGDPTQMEVLWFIQKYTIPVIIFVGSVGNIASFLVFVFTHLSRLSSSVYLAALAVADTGFLISLFITWLGYTKVFVYHTDGWCQVFVYVTYVCSFLNVWYVVSFTVERYIAVCHALKRQNMCSVKRARIVVTVLAAVSGIMYSFALWMSGITYVQGTPLCITKDVHLRVVIIINNVDTFVSLIIPLVSVLFMNIRIMWKIRYFYVKRSSLTAREVSVSSSNLSDMSVNALRNNNNRSLKNVAQMRITKMLLIVSFTFLILHSPSHVIRVHQFIMTSLDSEYIPSNKMLMWQQIMSILYCVNFATNFFLYSLCGRNFRVALKRLILSTVYRTRAFVQRQHSSVTRILRPNQTAFRSPGEL